MPAIILMVLMRTIEFGGISNGKEKEAAADVYISPDVLRFKRNDFQFAQELVEPGYRASREKMLEWRAAAPGNLHFGVLANVALALPALVDPAGSLKLMRMPEASPLFWPRFSGQAVVSLSVFYIPAAAIDPYQYRANAWLAAASRLSGVLFFGCVSMFSEDRQYWLFGVYDFAFVVPRAVLPTMMSRTDPSSGHRGCGRDSRTGFE